MKYKINSEAYNALSDADKARYAKHEDGSYLLTGIEGVVPKEALDEFRNNNIALKKQVDELTTKFGGVDLEAYQAMLATEQKIKEKKLLDAGQIDQLVAERTSQMAKKFESDTAAYVKENSTLKSNLERLIIDNGIAQAASKVGAKATAIEDLVHRGRSLFKVVDGAAVPMEGDKVIYGEDGRAPMSIEGWLKGLAPKAPHLFEASNGGGGGVHTQSTQSGKRVLTRTQYDALSPAEQQAAVRGKDAAVIVD